MCGNEQRFHLCARGVCRLFEEELPGEVRTCICVRVCSLGARAAALAAAQKLPWFSVLSKFIDWSPEKLGGIDL
jgi:hypothetical protein